MTYNLERLDRADPLLRQGFYSRSRQARLADSLRELTDVPAHFGLSHGDLTSRNLIAPDSGPLVLIDWGSASFGPVPWTDLLVLDRDARQAGSSVRPDVDAYLDAVGLSRAATWPTFERFRELQLLDLVRWAAERRPERLSDAMDDLASVL